MLPSSEYYLACEYYVCKNECERETPTMALLIMDVTQWTGCLCARGSDEHDKERGAPLTLHYLLTR